jgi:hypothetical protein
MAIKYLLFRKHSYQGTCQTNACLTRNCYRFHSDTFLLALPFSREFNGNGTFQEQKEAKIEELETFCKIKNISELYRGINNIKNCYHPRTTCVVSSGIQRDLCLLTTSTFFVNRISHMTASYFIWVYILFMDCSLLTAWSPTWRRAELRPSVEKPAALLWSKSLWIVCHLHWGNRISVTSYWFHIQISHNMDYVLIMKLGCCC